MTVACAKCGKRVIVHNVSVKDMQGVTKLQTCGKLVIEKKGKLIASLVEAHQGIEVLGTLESKEILVRGPVILGPKSTFKGDLCAEAVQIDKGAKITGGTFCIATESQRKELDLEDLPGIGAGAQGNAPAPNPVTVEPKPIRRNRKTATKTVRTRAKGI